MLYARIVFGLAVEGPFDYTVPENLRRKVKVGARVWVNFCNRRLMGFVVGLSQKTGIAKLKEILEIIDDYPLLDSNMLSLLKQVSDYYCCSWGEAIEAAFPVGFRKARVFPGLASPDVQNKKTGDAPGVTLLHDLEGQARWDVYINSIDEALKADRSVIVLLPDLRSLLKTKEKLAKQLRITPVVLERSQAQELQEWYKLCQGGVSVVLGLRSAVFAPVNNLGLIIIDDEHNSVYKQEQTPHYHAREVALMRVKMNKAKLILGSASPTLESFYLAQKNKIVYKSIPPAKGFPEIRIIESPYRRQNAKTESIISKILQDAIVLVLGAGKTALLFLNRKGFATFASCRNCGFILKCQRCSINLVYHFKGRTLSCHYCNFVTSAPEICPNCNAGYIHYSGAGTEKIESELARLFPQARVLRLDRTITCAAKDADLFVATSYIIKEADFLFDLVGVISIDNTLNRIDFRAQEKAFSLLIGLLGLTKGQLIVQTRLPQHHCFKALSEKNIGIFYKEELNYRKELKLPPYRHIALVKLRGKKESRVKESCEALFEKLQAQNQAKSVNIVSKNPGQPSKLRGNYYWQIMLKSNSAQKISGFLKKNLKDFRHSGIIVTVDVDPV